MDPTTKRELDRIHKKIKNPDAYGKLVAGVWTWDVADIFEDFRKVLSIAMSREGDGQPQIESRVFQRRRKYALP